MCNVMCNVMVCNVRVCNVMACNVIYDQVLVLIRGLICDFIITNEEKITFNYGLLLSHMKKRLIINMPRSGKM